MSESETPKENIVFLNTVEETPNSLNIRQGAIYTGISLAYI